MKFRIMGWILSLILFGSWPVSAQLVWKEKQISMEAPAGSRETKAYFAFTNEGTKAVVVREIKSSCNCTVPKLEKKVYQPGEGGQLEVVFNQENRTGLQKSSISVSTDDPNLSDTELRLLLNIRTWLQMSPPLVLWLKGATPETKEILFKVEPGVEIVSAKCAGDFFRVKKVVKDGTSSLEVKPASTKGSNRSALEVIAKLPDGTSKIFTAYAIVK